MRKALVFLLCLTPLAVLAWKGVRGELGANPIENIMHWTGGWTLRLLLVTLAVTPAHRLLKAPVILHYRRMLGLFAFFYGMLHLAVYVGLDMSFDVAEMLKDVVQRRFLAAGAVGLLAMAPLAFTSTAGRIRHLVYLSATAGVAHYWWLVKSDIREPALYAVILAVLLGSRLVSLPRPSGSR